MNTLWWASLTLPLHEEQSFIGLNSKLALGQGARKLETWVWDLSVLIQKIFLSLYWGPLDPMIESSNSSVEAEWNPEQILASR